MRKSYIVRINQIDIDFFDFFEGQVSAGALPGPETEATSQPALS